MYRIGHKTGQKMPWCQGYIRPLRLPTHSKSGRVSDNWFQFPQRPMGSGARSSQQTGKGKGSWEITPKWQVGLSFFFLIPLISDALTLSQSYCSTIKWFFISDIISYTFSFSQPFRTQTKNLKTRENFFFITIDGNKPICIYKKRVDINDYGSYWVGDGSKLRESIPEKQHLSTSLRTLSLPAPRYSFAIHC